MNDHHFGGFRRILLVNEFDIGFCKTDFCTKFRRTRFKITLYHTKLLSYYNNLTLWNYFMYLPWQKKFLELVCLQRSRRLSAPFGKAGVPLVPEQTVVDIVWFWRLLLTLFKFYVVLIHSNHTYKLVTYLWNRAVLMPRSVYGFHSRRWFTKIWITYVTIFVNGVRVQLFK